MDELLFKDAITPDGCLMDNKEVDSLIIYKSGSSHGVKCSMGQIYEMVLTKFTLAECVGDYQGKRFVAIKQFKMLESKIEALAPTSQGKITITDIGTETAEVPESNLDEESTRSKIRQQHLSL